MLKKVVKYVDYNGVESESTLYFALTPADLIEMEVNSGGYETMLKNMIDAKDYPSLLAVIQDIVKRSYGEKTSDGKHFYRSDEIFYQFKSSPAYSVLITDLLTDTDHAIEFVNGIFPNIDDIVASGENKVVQLPSNDA